MEGETFLLGQLIGSMADAVDKLESIKGINDFSQFNQVKSLILDLQKKIDLEADKIRI